MRSRYSAHCLLAIDYLWDTWAPAQRIRSSKQSIRDWACACEWLGLNILSTKEGSATDNQGIVEFKAHYRLDGENQTHHEISVFTKISEAWFYVDHQA
jgi:SEC-C motif-containing protein